MSSIHKLKILTVHFVAVFSGRKRAELRKFDRSYAEGDTLILQEWTEADGYTGREISVKVTHIANISAYAPGYLLLSFVVLS